MKGGLLLGPWGSFAFRARNDGRAPQRFTVSCRSSPDDEPNQRLRSEIASIHNDRGDT